MNKIYYHKIKSNIDKSILDSSILSPKEKNRAKTFKFEKDFNLYVAGKLLAKKKIAFFLKTRPEEIKFETDKYDRPFLDYPKTKNFDFNISHSGDYIVLAISDERIGIDIEKMKPIDLKISNDCFHEKEINYLFKNDKKQLENFYTIWTLKESFIKAIGEGLSYSLKNFYFDIQTSKISIKILDDSYQDKWNFRTYDIDDNYKLATCVNNLNLSDKILYVNDLL